MSREGDVWRLCAGDELVAELVVTEVDFPWLHALVKAHPGFARYRGLFDAEWEASEAEDWDTADGLYEEIRGALRLVDPKRVAVAEFLLHIEGSRAWWRWSDEPFTG